MIVSNVTCMKIEYIRLKHAKWVVGPLSHNNHNNCKICNTGHFRCFSSDFFTMMDHWMI
ncbi:hypothetical protein LDENG_00295610, partial [Lucifuga dentata]